MGDWILATAEARFYHDKFEAKCVFGDRERRKTFWEDEIFRNNPRLVKEPQEGDRVIWIANYPGNRPYIRGHDEKRVHWNHEFKAEPGELYLERFDPRSHGYILIEPSTKENVFSRNKAWPHWQKLVDSVDLPFLQIGKQKTLRGVTFIETKTFREALELLANAALVVTTDGALHHAAAALNIPSIVLWGGLISPEILGYGERASAKDIWHGTEPCGSKHECEHCKRAMAGISVEEVRDAIDNFGIPTAIDQGRLDSGFGKASSTVRRP